MFDFTNGRITLVISPVDMRSGFASLAGIARTYLSIDVYKGGHLVLFINRNRDICKLIWTDQSGLGWGAKFGPEGSSIIGSPSGNPE